MALSPGVRLGPYEVTAQIGVGGMGEVYRATDTNLRRAVAIKVLPESVSKDPDRLARFQREAEILATLNHPNVAQIYGLERADGQTALVMELVDGPTLADQIVRGAMPTDEALPIAKQIAEALEAAHEQGIIHRDLKPANIKIRSDGTVKVLDFGLAKATEPVSATSHSASRSPTITASSITEAGVILGTAAYMSPEQARGRAVDKRADIWAFGCVLYEMLTGRAAFLGETLSDTIAGVLEREPDWHDLPASMPSRLQDLVRRCLHKDPKRRLRDIGDAMNEIAELLNPLSVGVEAAPLVRPSASSYRLAVLVSAAAVLGGVVTASLLWIMKPWALASPNRVVQFVAASDGIDALEPSGLDRDLAISPDGTRLVYVAGGTGPVRLVSRSLAELRTTPLWDRGTPRAPFFSPDGQWIGFFESVGAVQKISASGGPATEITRGVSGAARGGSWGADNKIVFATTDPGIGLSRISADGGEPEVLTRPDRAKGELDHFWPEVLPGARAVLFTIVSTGSIDAAQIALLNLETNVKKVLVRGGTHAQYVQTGHLVYGAAGGLYAVPFDLESLEVTGSPVKVLEQVAVTGDGAVNAAVSQDGTLGYVRPAVGGTARTLVWVDRKGHEDSITAPPRPYIYPRLSPDGTRVALEVWDQDRDIWIWNLARETLTRLTDQPGRDGFPVWTPDGARLVFGSARDGSTNLFWRSADATGPVERLTTSGKNQFPYSISRSGNQLVVREDDLETGFDISVVSLIGDRRATSLIRTGFNELNAEISPDGRWLAYQSNESGQDEIYVRPFPQVSTSLSQISKNGGTRPLWSHNSQELFYLAPDGLYAVPVAVGTRFEAGRPTRVTERRYFSETAFIGRTYDVSPDGQRFLMIKGGGANGGTARPELIVVQNWSAELNRLVPTP
jgi:serine/threonine-protein kinase